MNIVNAILLCILYFYIQKNILNIYCIHSNLNDYEYVQRIVPNV